jgi:hypothetical protein
MIDIDEDGFVELIVVGHEQNGSPSSIYWGNSTGVYHPELKTLLPPVLRWGTVIDFDAEDIDSDGDRDLILTRTGGGSINFYRGYHLQILVNEGEKRFVDQTERRIEEADDPNGVPIYWIHLQDLDGNGALDIMEDEFLRGAPAAIWLNDGPGRFVRPSSRFEPVISDPVNLSIDIKARINSEGNLEVLIFGSMEHKYRLFESVNLTDWPPIRDFEIESEPFKHIENIRTEVQKKFYSAQLLAD